MLSRATTLIIVSLATALVLISIFYISSTELSRFRTSEDKVKEMVLFETLAKGAYSGWTERAHLVIRDENTFGSVWSKVYSGASPAPPLPQVDFSREMVIAVFSGEKSTGGYGIEIAEIINRSDILEVRVIERTPGRGCFVTQALSRPYHIVKLPLINKTVIFTESKETIDCIK